MEQLTSVLRMCSRCLKGYSSMNYVFKGCGCVFGEVMDVN